MLLVAGCATIPHYRQPERSEPHARVLIRFSHGARTDEGPLDDVVWLDATLVPLELRRDDGTIALRVAPGRLEWAFKTSRYHEEERIVTHRGGPPGLQRTTHRSEYDHVSEGGCRASLLQTARAGSDYIVEYTYASPEDCHATCRRIVRAADGSESDAECE